jgi:two-component system sensor histidine kinase TctE
VDVRIGIGWPVTRLEIEDTGPGIPAAERTRVFERFYRIPRTDGPQGSGLGLAIVSAICDRIGAKVTLGDRPQGAGLLVTVEFATGKAATKHLLPAEAATG